MGLMLQGLHQHLVCCDILLLLSVKLAKEMLTVKLTVQDAAQLPFDLAEAVRVQLGLADPYRSVVSVAH
jgi:hypothetical protein